MTDITERRRPHEEAHVRTLDQQILDALLRIEELLDGMMRAYLSTLPLNALPPGAEDEPAQEPEEKPVRGRGRRR